MIGTLNEGALHRQLKEWYRRPGSEEHRVRLVAPIAASRRIVRLSPEGEILSGGSPAARS